MTQYDPGPAIRRIPDRSSLVPNVLEFLYEKSRARKAEVNGGHIYYKEEGTGEPVVLLSPLGADTSFWARQAQELAQSFRVITYDGRGSGVSSEAPDGCSTELLAHDLIVLLEHLGVDQAHLVGLALGGLVAQWAAILRPQLVASLVLTSCYSVADQRIRQLTETWRDVATTEGMETLFGTCLEWLFSPTYIRANREEFDRIETFFRLTRQDAGDFCLQSLAGVQHNPGPLVGSIRCPTLVVHGEADRLVEVELGRRLASQIPSARMVVLEGGPHFLTWEQAPRFNREVSAFLCELQPAAHIERAPSGNDSRSLHH